MRCPGVLLRPRLVLRLILAALIWGRDRLGLLIVLSVPLYASLLHAFVVSKPRYNLPLMPLLAAAGCAAAAMLLARRAASRTAARDVTPS